MGNRSQGLGGAGDERELGEVVDASPNVSTNRVYRLLLGDGTCAFAKVASYGSFIHFRQDPQRIARWIELLAGGRFEGFLASVLCRDGEVFTRAQAFEHGGRAGQDARGVLQHPEGVEEDHRVAFGEFGEIHRAGWSPSRPGGVPRR